MSSLNESQKSPASFEGRIAKADRVLPPASLKASKGVRSFDASFFIPDWDAIEASYQSGETLTNLWLSYCQEARKRGQRFHCYSSFSKLRKRAADKHSAATVERPQTSLRALSFDSPYLVLDESGVALQIRRGELCVRRGDGAERLFPVRKHGLRHIVLAGHGASLTSEAARWLIAEGVHLTLAGRSGEAIGLLGHSPETDYSSLALAARRAQWEALLNRRRSIEIARAIVATKMERVASVLERFAVTSGGSAPSPSIVDGAFGSPRGALAELTRAKSIDAIILVEGKHAQTYWRILRPAFTLEFSDDAPVAWRRFESRASGLWHTSKRTNRHASTPANAMLNYAYAATLNRKHPAWAAGVLAMRGVSARRAP